MTEDELKTPLENQKQLISIINSKINSINKQKKAKGEPLVVEPVSSSRTPHLRLRFLTDEKIDVVKVLSDEIFNGQQIFEVKPGKKIISGDYDTQILKLLKPIGQIPADTEIYLIVADVNKKQSSFGKNSSELKPDKFHFNGKILDENKITSETKNAFENIKSVSKLKTEIKLFCIDLLDQVEHHPPRNGQETTINSKYGELIEPQDINTIAKNFGEILGALWYMKTDPIKDNKTEYPKSNNERLIDYTIHTNKNNSPYLQPISAKSKEGAPSAISGLIVGQKNRIKNIKIKKQSLEFVYYEFLNDLCTLNTQESILYVNSHFLFETTAFKKLKNKIRVINKYEGMANTIRKIENYINTKYVKKIDRRNPQSIEEAANSFLEDFSDVFEACSFSPDFGKVKSAMLSNSKIELLLYPLGRVAANAMNENETLVDFFNSLMKSTGISQISINLTKTKMTFTLYNDPRLERSSRGTYYFEYNASYSNPKNKGLSFKLKPGK